ncbi:MAG: HAD family phosphatase [Casimicrobiaceae bacterium]
MPTLDRLPQAVIFDMDGLMLDTEPLAARAWDEAAAAVGASFDPGMARRMIGHNFHDCSAMLRAGCPAGYPVDAILSRWHAAYDAIVERDGLAIKPGVFELIDWLDGRGIVRAVATSTRRDRAHSKLARTALLSRFAALVGGDEIARGKPAPDIYLEAARRLGTMAPHCVVLEDSEPGVRGALAAGMLPIMVPDLLAPTAELLAFDIVVHASLHDVAETFARLETQGRPPGR